MNHLTNLLVIDDNPDFLETLTEVLTEEKLSVTGAGSAQEALKLLENNEVDAIICDFNMPDMNGLEFLKALRGKGIYTPFILASGHIDQETLKLGLKLGAFDVFEKPIRFDKLSGTVIKAIHSGIQYRGIIDKIKAEVPEARQKVILSHFKTLAILRAANS